MSGFPQHSGGPGSTWGDLSPLVDRPFLQHVVEYIVGQGVGEIDFVLPDEGHAARRILGDGMRWGARFCFYSAGGESAYGALAQIPLREPDELILFGHSDRLPFMRLDSLTDMPTLFCSRGKELRWSGWGAIRAADALHIPKTIGEKGLFRFLSEAGGGMICQEGPRPLTASSHEDLIEANRRVLAKEFPGLLMGGKEVQPNVWMARNATVHPTAKITAPAFVGENSVVGAGVQLGPGASIGKDCMIERETFVSDSVICRGSYVGQRLALRGVIVDRSRLVSTRWDAEIEGIDELLLGSVFGTPLPIRLSALFGRFVAALALILASPLLCAMFLASVLRVIPALQREFMVRTPALSEPWRWKTFSYWSFGRKHVPVGGAGWLRHCFFCFLPALPAIAAGHIALAGPSPRTKEELEFAMPSDRASHLRSRCGVLPFDSSRRTTRGGDPVRPEPVDARFGEAFVVMTRYAGLVLRSLFCRTFSAREQRKAE